MYLAKPEQVVSACSFLAEAGLDVGGLLDRDAFSIGDVTDAYVTGGSLEPELRLAGHAVLVQQALNDGFDGLRVCSEIAPLLAHDAVRDEWCGYELRADVLIATLPSVVVCACDLRGVERRVADAARELTAVHGRSAGPLAACSVSPPRRAGRGVGPVGRGRLVVGGPAGGDGSAPPAET